MNTDNYSHKSQIRTELRPKSAKRRQAEKKIRMVEELQSDLLDPKTVRQLVHDLRAYQIELEIQNEELRGLQQELELSKSRYKELYDYAPAGYITVSEQGVIVEGNRTAAHLLNVGGETLVGQTFFRFILAEDQDIYYQHRAAIFETTEPQSCKLRLLRPDLPPFWVRLVTAPVGEETDHSPAMCLLMFNDIDDAIRLAEEKNQLEAKCRNLEKAESLGRMAGAIAHSFNNLLGVMMGNLELAEDAIAQKTDSFRYITSSMQAARRAAEVSGSLLTYLGQSFAQQQPLDFATTCQSGIGKLQAVMPKEIDIVADFPIDRPLVNANADQIHQVLKNLLTNAWESQNRGTIHLSMQTITPEDIPAARRFPLDSQFEHRLYACLAVRDTGCGIAAPAIEQIFDPFYTSSFLGRGLGLPIVLGIVRAHGGFITVTSKVGKGSIFRVFVPVYEEEMSQSTRQATARQQHSEGKTGMKAENTPMHRELA